MYRDVTSKLAMCLFSMFAFFIFCMRSPEFFKCAGLIVPSSGVSIFVMALAILWGALPIPEMIGLKGMFGLCVFGRPYNLGVVGWYSMCLVHVLFSCCNILLRDLLKVVVCLLMNAWFVFSYVFLSFSRELIFWR